MHENESNLYDKMSFENTRIDKSELIHRAAREGRVFSLETYLTLYPNVNINKQYSYRQSKWTILMAACFFRHENIVRMLLRRFKPDINAVGNVKLDFVHDVMYGVSSLWVAVAMGHFGIVQMLIEEGNADVNHLSITRSSPLRAASYVGNLEITRYLIKHGADMKLVRNGNYTNLMLSAYRKHVHIVKYFLDELNSDPNEFDQDGRTPLHYAIDGGSLEVIQLLLECGAKNRSNNTISPLLWASLEAREDLVNAFQYHCNSDLEWIESKELLGATCANIESKYYNLEKAIEHLKEAFKLREEKCLPKISSNVPSNRDVFHHWKECETLKEFDQILSESNDRLHIESLLIQERILGQSNKRYRRAIRFYGALLADTHRYDESIKFWLYELNIRQQHRINLDKWHLREFVHMFSEMIVNKIEIIPENAILELLRAIQDEMSNGRNNDYNLYTLFYLITVISHLPDEQRFSSSMADVYQTVTLLIRKLYRTIENSLNWTLLHISMMNGLSCGSDSHMMAFCRYPCQKAIDLLIQCGADVDAFDCEKNSPLHLLVQRRNDIESILCVINLLCDRGGAHIDHVNNQRLTPLELASNTCIKEHLRKKIGVGRLKCLCSRLIRQCEINYKDCIFSLSLVNFIEKH